MELKLNRPICFFDLETTGIDVARDRIVEISVVSRSKKQIETKKVKHG